MKKKSKWIVLGVVLFVLAIPLICLFTFLSKTMSVDGTYGYSSDQTELGAFSFEIARHSTYEEGSFASYLFQVAVDGRMRSEIFIFRGAQFGPFSKSYAWDRFCFESHALSEGDEIVSSVMFTPHDLRNREQSTDWMVFYASDMFDHVSRCIITVEENGELCTEEKMSLTSETFFVLLTDLGEKDGVSRKFVKAEFFDKKGRLTATIDSENGYSRVFEELEDGQKEAEAKTEEEADSPLWAKDQMELCPGMEVEGVFDSSREIIKVSVKQDGSEIKLFVDGEEKLSVPGNSELFLQDICEEDACLELLVGEPLMASIHGGEEKKYFRVTAYRLHPGEIAEVPLFPSQEGNSFYVDEFDWTNYGIDNWYFGSIFYCHVYDPVQEKWVEMGYKMMPEGYLMDRRNALALIYVDGNPINLPEENVKIDEKTGVGIAFMPDWGMAGLEHYNIYRSEDFGKTWSLVMEDFKIAQASIDQIYILEENTIFCRFHPSGVVSCGNSTVVTLDGGRSWEYVEHVEGMEKYEFLKGYKGELLDVLLD